MIEDDNPHEIKVGLLAPYPCWYILQVLEIIAGIVLLVWIVSFIRMIIYGGQVSALPFWVFIGGFIIAGRPVPYRSRHNNLAPFGEIIGGLLASKQCPQCGQSIFDHTPPQGYAPDLMKRLWPLTDCANCGLDLSNRTAEDQS
jgi:hypothetical protein